MGHYDTDYAHQRYREEKAERLKNEDSLKELQQIMDNFDLVIKGNPKILSLRHLEHVEDLKNEITVKLMKIRSRQDG